MRTVKSLKAEAMEACDFRGHNMGGWERVRPGVYAARCVVCGKQVCVEQRTAPNSIDIGGEAVALGCED